MWVAPSHRLRPWPEESGWGLGWVGGVGWGGRGWRDWRADSDRLSSISSSISVSLSLICYGVSKRVPAFTGRSWSCPHAFPWVTRWFCWGCLYRDGEASDTRTDTKTSSSVEKSFRSLMTSGLTVISHLSDGIYMGLGTVLGPHLSPL